MINSHGDYIQKSATFTLNYSLVIFKVKKLLGQHFKMGSKPKPNSQN